MPGHLPESHNGLLKQFTILYNNLKQFKKRETKQYIFVILIYNAHIIL